MSLQFSQDPLSKREKQELFKMSLDDQRRMKQEASSEQNHVLGGNGGNHVPGLGAPIPNHVTVVPGLYGVPGLDSAPRFEGSASPQQEKQPYMSALSEMNGRPLHVRQQQYQKESQYRNMLKDQIEENKKRKEAEKAKLDEEKRQELEEVRRLQGVQAPRRQQHAQFQESPDHPLPSPGRLPPARHHHTVADQQPQNGVVGSQGHVRPRGVIPVHGGSTAAGGNEPDYTEGVGGLGCVGAWQGRQSAPDDGQGQSAEYRGRRGSDQLQVDLPVHPTDLAASGRREVASHVQARNDTLSRHVSDYDGRSAEAGRPRGRLSPTTHSHTGDSAARTLAFGRTGRGEASTAHEGGGGYSDSVPRADYDELSNLCRDLLLEQKRLRQKLEEREERENLAAERSTQQDELSRQHRQEDEEKHQRRRMPRRRGTGTRKSGEVASSIGDGKGRDPSISGSATSRVQSNVIREGTVRRDDKPNPKPAVAFGSTRSRMPHPSVPKPRITSGSKSSQEVSRGNREARVSKSEPVPRTDYPLDSQQLRNVVSPKGRNGGIFAHREASASRWHRDDEDIRGMGSARFAGAQGDSDWVSRAENVRKDESAQPSEARDGSSSIGGLRGSGIGHHALPPGGAGAVSPHELGYRYGTESGELDGESTFLDADPTGPGSRLRDRFTIQK